MSTSDLILHGIAAQAEPWILLVLPDWTVRQKDPKSMSKHCFRALYLRLEKLYLVHTETKHNKNLIPKLDPT